MKNIIHPTIIGKKRFITDFFWGGQGPFTVHRSKVMSDRATGRSRGFGFVSFDVPDAVEQIMAMHKDWEWEDQDQAP